MLVLQEQYNLAIRWIVDLHVVLLARCVSYYNVLLQGAGVIDECWPSLLEGNAIPLDGYLRILAINSERADAAVVVIIKERETTSRITLLVIVCVGIKIRHANPSNVPFWIFMLVFLNINRLERVRRLLKVKSEGVTSDGHGRILIPEQLHPIIN